MASFCEKCRYTLLFHKGGKCPDLPPVPDTEPIRVSENNAKQVGGEHYKKMTIQHWDFVIANNLDYLQGCATKYIIRHKDKGGKKDLLKAIHYLEKMIEVHYPTETKS